MGSGQSSPPDNTPPKVPADADAAAIKGANVDEDNDTKGGSLSGMPLVQYKCRKRKKVYDKCVRQWYSKEFLPGKSVDQAEACGDLFDNYRQCVLKGIRKEIWDKQGLPPPKEGSPLSEVEDDE